MRPPDSRTAGKLLDVLCHELGYCIDDYHSEGLRATPPATPEEFTDAVFRLEGMDPRVLERGVYRLVLNVVQSVYSDPHRFD